MNNDNEGKCYGVSTDFIRKMTGFFFITIGEESSTNIPFSKMYRFNKKCNNDTFIWNHVIELDDYPPYSDKISHF